MPALTKEQIARADDRKMEQVPCPEWGGEGAYVLIRTMTADEIDRFESANVTIGKDGVLVPNRKNVRARLAALVICDEQGERLYSDSEVGVLAQRNGAVLTRIVEAASRINMLRPQDLEDARKNSSLAQPDASSSGSHDSNGAST